MSQYTATLQLGGRQYSVTRQPGQTLTATLGGGGDADPPFVWGLSNATTATVPVSIHGKVNAAQVVCSLADGEQVLPDLLRIDPVTKTVYFFCQLPISGQLTIF